MTPLDLITSAMKHIGVLATGEVPEADEAADGFVALNAMYDAWSADRLMIYATARMGPFTLTPGQQTYTLGPGGGPFNLSAVRPPKIQNMGVLVLSNPLQPVEYPVDMLTDEQWAAIPVKNIQSSFPQKCWDDGGFPQRVLSLWCIPNTVVQLIPYAWTALQRFADLTTDYTFPPGYEEAITFNLAIRLAPDFGAEISPAVASTAITTKGYIRRMNAPIIDLRLDSALAGDGGIYDWRSDTFVKRGG